MNDNVDQVISEDLQRPEMIIEGKREIHNPPWSEKAIKGKIMVEVSNRSVVRDLADIIKNKFVVKGIAINDDHR